MTWPEVADTPGPILVVPLGSTEQHGPHLPLDTDTRIAVALAEGAAGSPSAPPCLVAPALSYGSSGEHAGFAGTLSIGQAALEAVVVELVRSADAFDGVVLVMGHAGNADAVVRARRVLVAEGRAVTVWFPRMPGGDAHAGRTETSLMAAIDPASVRADRAAPGATAPLADLLPALRSGGVAAVAPNGVLGDPTGADAAQGAALLEALTADLLAALHDHASRIR